MFKLIIVTILLTPQGEWVPYKRELPFKEKAHCELTVKKLLERGFPPFVYVCAPVTQTL